MEPPRHALPALLVILLASSVARADPDADAEAEALFDDGRALMKEGRFQEACPKLEKSQRLSPRGGTLLNVAACHERQGKIATAWVEFQQALTAARTEGKDDRARLAQERIDVLQPRLPWVELDVSQTAGDELTVTLDDRPVAPVAWRKEMPVDPGDHRVVATAPGRASAEQRFRIEEGEHRKVAILPGEPSTAPPEPATPKAPAPVPRDAPDREPTHRRHRVVAEGGAFGGILSGGVSSVEPQDGGGSITLQDQQSGLQSSCAQASCDYDLGGAEALVMGATGFLGYSITERFHFGFRGLAGFRLGGGFVIAAGPAISGRIWGPIWAGTSIVAGDILELGRGTARAPSGTYAVVSDNKTSVSATTGLTVGNGIELGLALFETDSGALFVQMNPLFLIGSKAIAVTLPIGLAYRFF